MNVHVKQIAHVKAQKGTCFYTRREGHRQWIQSGNWQQEVYGYVILSEIRQPQKIYIFLYKAIWNANIYSYTALKYQTLTNEGTSTFIFILIRQRTIIGQNVEIKLTLSFSWLWISSFYSCHNVLTKHFPRCSLRTSSINDLHFAYDLTNIRFVIPGV